MTLMCLNRHFKFKSVLLGFFLSTSECIFSFLIFCSFVAQVSYVVLKKSDVKVAIVKYRTSGEVYQK